MSKRKTTVTGSFPCRVCGKVFNTERKYQQHAVQHSGHKLGYMGHRRAK